jgi:hypothetical protein
VGVGFLVFFRAFDEDGFHAHIFAEFYVGQGIAYDQTGGWGDLRKIYLGLFEEARQRFAAVALLLIVRAKVKAIDASTVFCKYLIQLRVDRFHVFRGVKAQGNATLVGDYDYTQTGLIQSGDGFRDAGEQMEVPPVGDVLAFGELSVDYAVAVKKDGLQSSRLGWGLRRPFWRNVHPAMIAIGRIAA